MSAGQRGDQRAYATLLDEVAGYLRGLCRRYLGRDDEVEDVLQEILLTIHSVRHTYEPGRPFKPWLHALAGRRIVDWIRRRARRQGVEVREPHGAAEALPSGRIEAEPERATIRDDDARDIHRAIAALPPRQREAVILLHLRELSLGEAAGVTQQTAGALKVACHRALKSLRVAFRGDDRG